MAKKPPTALVMHPVVLSELMREDHLQRLDRCTTLLASDAFPDIAALDTHRDHVEVLITSWGCPRVDEETIRALPRLKLVAHLAGSVKGFLDDVVWRRGILVCNAVAANAVPVAEYTLAAILFANKRVFGLSHYYRQHKKNNAPWTREAPNVGNYGKTVGIIGAVSYTHLTLPTTSRV